MQNRYFQGSRWPATAVLLALGAFLFFRGAPSVQDKHAREVPGDVLQLSHSIGDLPSPSQAAGVSTPGRAAALHGRFGQARGGAALRRQLFQQAMPSNEADTVCPGMLAPGTVLRVLVSCTIANLPARLARPGAEMLGPVPEGGNPPGSLPLVLFPDSIHQHPQMAVQPGATLQLTRLLFQSATDEDRASMLELLTPHFVGLEPGAALTLTDAAKLMDLQPEAVAQTFKSVLSEPELSRALREWKFVIYTDYQSWMHVNWYASGGLMAKSFGVINARGLIGTLALDTGSFALEVTNASLVAVLTKYATVDTQDPFLMYLQGNTTFWPRGDWPAAGIHIMRPLVIIGWTDAPTGVDFGNCAGCASLTGHWSNVTFDSLVLENVGYGDPANPNATSYSVVSATNMWFFNASRCEPRMVLRNSTIVVPLDLEVDMARYWSGVFNSPVQSTWLRQGLNVTAWEVRVETSDSLTFTKFVSSFLLVQETVLTAVSQVFPKRPTIGWDLRHVASFYQTHMPLPSVSLCNNAQDFMAIGRRLARPMVCLLTHDVVSMAPDLSVPWPPAGGLVVQQDSYLVLHGRHDDKVLGAPNGTFVYENAASHTGVQLGPEDGRRRRRRLRRLAGMRDSEMAEEEVTDHDVVTHVDRSSGEPVVLVLLGYAAPLLDLQNGFNQDGGILELQSLRLGQLPQGPGAAAATSLDDPAVWTLMLWSFKRSTTEALNVSEVEFMLPVPEYEEIKRRRGSKADFSIYLQGAVVTFSETRYLDEAQTHMFIRYMEGYMLSGHEILLSSDPSPDVALPPNYNWPRSADVAGGGGGASLSPAAQQALIVTLTVASAVAAALLALVMFAAVRRRRRAALSGEDLEAFAGVDGSLASKRLSGKAAAAAAGLYSEHPSGHQHRNGGPDGGAGGRALSVHAGQRSGSAGGEPRGSTGSSTGGGRVLAANGAPCVGERAVRTASEMSSSGAGAYGDGSGGAAAAGGGLSSRWRQLLLAINSRVTDIHAKRLAAGLSAGGAGSGSASESDPLPLLPRSGSLSLTQQRRPPWDGGAGGLPQLVGGGGAAGGGSYTVGQSANSFRSTPSGSRAMPRHGQPQQLQLLDPLGSGSFGSVFRARWHGAEVAVKLVQLPATLGGGGGAGGEAIEGDRQAAAFASARERMAVQEAAISTTMTHPHIVALYCIGLRPVQSGAGGYCGGPVGLAPGSPGEEPWVAQEGEDTLGSGQLAAGAGDPSAAGVVVAWELQLIMEFCDQGTLRQALDAGRLWDPATGLSRLLLVLSLAHHVASAMQYLHEECILHGDLKPSNVLLRSQPGTQAAAGRGAPEPLEPGCLVAKVSDFGLSWSMDATTTHVSSCHAGTMTHMSPELLLHGKASKASDVYAYGMLLWELATGGRAFSDVPKPLLGHAIVQQRLRPAWPPPAVGPAWAQLRELTEMCWAHDAAIRPSFSSVVNELDAVEALLQADPASCQLPPANAAAACAAATGGVPWWQQPGWQGLQSPEMCESRVLDDTSSRLAVVMRQQQLFQQQEQQQHQQDPALALAPPQLQPQAQAPLAEQQMQQVQGPEWHQPMVPFPQAGGINGVHGAAPQHHHHQQPPSAMAFQQQQPQHHQQQQQQHHHQVPLALGPRKLSSPPEALPNEEDSSQGDDDGDGDGGEGAAAAEGAGGGANGGGGAGAAPGAAPGPRWVRWA